MSHSQGLGASGRKMIAEINQFYLHLFLPGLQHLLAGRLLFPLRNRHDLHHHCRNVDIVILITSIAEWCGHCKLPKQKRLQKHHVSKNDKFKWWKRSPVQFPEQTFSSRSAPSRTFHYSWPTNVTFSIKEWSKRRRCSRVPHWGLSQTWGWLGRIMRECIFVEFSNFLTIGYGNFLEMTKLLR